MSQRYAYVAGFFLCLSVALVLVVANPSQSAPSQSLQQKSFLDHLEPGQQVTVADYEGGLVRLIVHEIPEGKTVTELPTVKRVTDEYVELFWDTEERTATQILAKHAILEIWTENELKPTGGGE